MGVMNTCRESRCDETANRKSDQAVGEHSRGPSVIETGIERGVVDKE